MNILVGVIFVFGFSPVSFKCPHTPSYNFYMKTKLFFVTRLYNYESFLKKELPDRKMLSSKSGRRAILKMLSKRMKYHLRHVYSSLNGFFLGQK
jgi:hypothetical protein